MMHAIAASDAQQQDTYFIVAHIHYVLFGGAIFAILAGVYYWFPKLTGRMYNEKMGQLHFWLMFIGQNVTFFPMHFTGLNGMPRRIYAYYSGMGWDFWNLVSTLGGVHPSGRIRNLHLQHGPELAQRRASQRGPVGWSGRWEWSIPSPPPEYNFAEVPHVQDRDDWWEEKQRRRERREAPVVAGGSEQEDAHNIHLPQPSYWPFFVSLGLFIVGFSLVYLINMNEAGIRTVNYVALTHSGGRRHYRLGFGFTHGRSSR